MRGRAWGAAALLAAAHLALVLHGASRHSAVFDEIVYAPAGFSYLSTGDFRLNPEHPPFLKLLLGASWTGAGFDAPATPGWRERDQWQVGQRAFYGPGRPHDALLMRARAVIALLSVGLALAVFAVARAIAGDAAGLAALALYALDPLVVAHAGFATLDLGGAALFFVAAVALPGALLRGGALRVAVTGLASGAALATKFSNLPLLAILVLVATLGPWLTGGGFRPAARRAAAVLGLSLVVVAAASGPAGPGLYLRGLGLLRGHEEIGHPTYAFGLYSSTGWWWYFPAAWLVKTPIPLLLASTAGILALLRRARADVARCGVLLLSPALVAAAVMTSPLNLGVRHLLQVTPFLAAAGGVALAGLWRGARTGRAAVVVLLVWLAAGTLRVHPFEMAYANEAASGPSRLWRLLADSNLDWGQDLPALADEVHRFPLRRLYLGYFGTADPGAYGLPYCWISSDRMVDRRYEDGPDPGGREWIALSVTNLLDVYSPRKDQHAWLRERPFTAFPGYSIALFDITGDAAAHLRLGETALDLRDYETAEAPLRRAVELAPRDGRARLDLAAALAFLGRAEEAVSACAEAERLLPGRETAEACGRIRARAADRGRAPSRH